MKKQGFIPGSIIVALVSWFIEYLGFKYLDYISVGVISLTPILLPLIVFISYFITYPFEKMISNSYISRAKKKLKTFDNI